MKDKLRIMLIGIIISLLIISCQNESLTRNNFDKIKEEKIFITEVSEEDILKVKANEYLDAGKTIEEIISQLKNNTTYQDLLRFMGEKDYKNQRKAKKIDFDAYLIDEGLRTKNKYNVRLRYIIHEDTIRYALIKTIDTSYSFERIRENIEIIKNEKFIKEYVVKHNQVYKTQKEPNDFVKEVIMESYFIRIAAGHHGKGYGKRDIELFRAVKNKNIDFIENCLKSMNLENQILGIIGIEKLKSQEVEIDEKVEKIIEHIKKRNSLISCDYTCTSLEMKTNRYLSAMNWAKVPNIEIE